MNIPRETIENVAEWFMARESGQREPLVDDVPEHPLSTPDAEEEDKIPLAEPCGVEDRVRQEQTDRFPWSAICYLVIHKNTGTYRGTGFFIAPDTVVTAGHCLVTRWTRAERIEVIPGRNGSVRPFGSVEATRFVVPDEWREQRRVAFDYGVIKLDDGGLGERTGFFDLAAPDDEELRSATLNTGGYPGDMALSRCPHFNAGPCRDVEEQRLSYMLDTWTGASGSPVWIKSGITRQVVGIHNYGHCPNRATRVNERVLADLRAWSAL